MIDIFIHYSNRILTAIADNNKIEYNRIRLELLNEWMLGSTVHGLLHKRFF